MSSRWSARRSKFRSIISGGRCVHPASVHDPISARIAVDLGFETGMFAGSVASLAVLGAPDLIVLTLTEFAGQAYRISRAAELPLLVDADHGYGNALSVMRTVEELETAGVAGLSIEDTVLPRPFAANETVRLISIAEGVGKMQAAIAGRRDPDLVIAGRTSAIGITSVDDTIARANAYVAAGVDAIFLVGVKTQGQLDALAAANLGVPLILGGVPAALMNLDMLSAKGVRVCLQGHQPFQAATQAIYDTLKALRGGATSASLRGLASSETMARVTRAGEYAAQVREWLGGRG